MNTYRKKNYRSKRSYSGRPRRTVDNYHQPSPPDRELIPVSQHTLTKPDVEAVVEALLSGTLLHGQELERFESLFAKLTHSDHAIAVASGGAALHAALACLKLEPEDEVITSTLNDFSAANMIKLVGAKPVLVDCHADTLTISIEATTAAINEHTKAILANNFAGHPSDLSQLRELCAEHNLVLIEDASHGLGGKYRGHYVGNQADITCFSFQPSMAITTCEGGAVTTNNRAIAEWIRQFCNHGLPQVKTKDKDTAAKHTKLQFAGMNYMLSDVLAALGRSQLTRLDRHIERRRSIAQVYQQKLNGVDHLRLPFVAAWADHAYHLFPIQLVGDMANHREKISADLRNYSVDTGIFYTPIHQMPAYADQADPERFPNAEAFYSQSLCLPLFPDLSYKDIERITDQLQKLLNKYGPKPNPVMAGEVASSSTTDTEETATVTDQAEIETSSPASTPEESIHSDAQPSTRNTPEKGGVSSSRKTDRSTRTQKAPSHRSANLAAKKSNQVPKPQDLQDDTPNDTPAESEMKQKGDSGRLRKIPKADTGEEATPGSAAQSPRITPRKTTRSRTKPKKDDGANVARTDEKPKPKRARSPRPTTTSTRKPESDETKPRPRRARPRKPKVDVKTSLASETTSKTTKSKSSAAAKRRAPEKGTKTEKDEG